MRTILAKAKEVGVSELTNVADTIIKKNNSNGNKILSTNIKWDSW